MTEVDRYGHPVERVIPDRPAPIPPLSPAEIEKIVDLVVAYTRRQPDATMVEVWAAQSVIGRWTFPEAARAIHLWGRDRQPGQWLEPSDVTRLVRAERQDRAMREEAARLAAIPADPAAAKRVEQITRELAARMGWSEESVDRANFALKVGCPHCGAAVNTRCTTPSTGRPLQLSTCHPARAEALAEHLRTAS